MKNLFILLAFVIVAIAANAQRGKVVSLTADTVQGNETIYISTNAFTGDDPFTLQALCTQVGGTTDGTMTLEGSVDGTSYVALTDQTGIVKGYPNDSLTMTNGAVQVWVVEKNLFNKYRIKIAGTASDTTLITPKILRK